MLIIELGLALTVTLVGELGLPWLGLPWLGLRLRIGFSLRCLSLKFPLSLSLSLSLVLSLALLSASGSRLNLCLGSSMYWKSRDR